MYEYLVGAEDAKHLVDCQEKRVLDYLKRDDENSSSSDVSGFSDLQEEEKQLVEKIKQKRLDEQLLLQ